MTAAKKPRPRKGRTVVRWVLLCANGRLCYMLSDTKRQTKQYADPGDMPIRVTISLPLRGDKK